MSAKKKPTLTCETTTLADALTKAARVAPKAGPAFSSAAGLLLEINTNVDEPLVVKATDNEVTYRQRINALDVNGEPITWRVPVLLAEIVTGMTGAEVTLNVDEKTGRLEVKSGRKKARLPLVTGGTFPVINKFDPKLVAQVDDLAHRIGQVQWCTMKDLGTPCLAGINITGTELRTTDREKAVTVPCVMPVTQHITVPLTVVATMIGQLSELKVGADEHHLLLMPDDDTQITSTIYSGDFPTVERIQRADHSVIVTLSKAEVVAAIQAMQSIAKEDKLPVLRLTFGDGVVGLYVSGGEIGELEDEVSCEGNGEGFVLYVTPRNFLGAVTNAGVDRVTFSCGPLNKQTFTVSDDHGYRCDGMPRQVETKKGATAPVKDEEDAA